MLMEIASEGDDTDEGFSHDFRCGETDVATRCIVPLCTTLRCGGLAFYFNFNANGCVWWFKLEH